MTIEAAKAYSALALRDAFEAGVNAMRSEAVKVCDLRAHHCEASRDVGAEDEARGCVMAIKNAQVITPEL